MYELALFQLRKNLDVLIDLVKNVTEEQQNWRSSDDAFSVHETLCHFYEMEINYYRPQMQLLLSNPKEELPEIETHNWRYLKLYNAKDFRTTLRKFIVEREASVRWLESIDEKKWEASFTDSSSSRISAKLFLLTWLNNDYKEFQKIVQNKFEFINQEPTLQPLRYAGYL